MATAAHPVPPAASSPSPAQGSAGSGGGAPTRPPGAPSGASSTGASPGGSNTRANESNPAPFDTKFAWVARLHESMSAIIGLAILAIAGWMLVRVFIAAGVPATDKTLYQQQKDVMLYALALLGTVTGYYLGRAPAERRADAAEAAASTAQRQVVRQQDQVTAAVADEKATRQQAAEKDRSVRQQLSSIKATIDSAGAGGGPQRSTLGMPSGSTGASMGAAANPDLQQASAQIDALLATLQ